MRVYFSNGRLTDNSGPFMALCTIVGKCSTRLPVKYILALDFL